MNHNLLTLTVEAHSKGGWIVQVAKSGMEKIGKKYCKMFFYFSKMRYVSEFHFIKFLGLLGK